MNQGIWLFLGVFLTFASAWLGLVFFPNAQLKDLQAQRDEITGRVDPSPYSGEALRGRRVYVTEGCVYCHTQQVRGGDYNADLERGWGARRSHPRDYIHDVPQLLGTMRTGPDLINIGARQPSADWHLKHLLNPQITSPGSIMPPYSYLFDVQQIVGQRSYDALELEEEWAPPRGYEVVPTAKARELVAYLLSLDRNYEIEEE
ncbi:MAG: cbb3-type cytochrome c oxidase subunit II [Planctomycetota bacterium]|jgi:cytochrome c oxidase cbb3-type subunit 2